MLFNTAIREVLKIPQLISHFDQHHALNPQISFIDFLEMHYYGEDLDDNDDEEDMKLPFKKIDGHHVLSIGGPTEKFVQLKVACLNLLTKCNFSYQLAYSNPTFGILFRPPIALA